MNATAKRSKPVKVIKPVIVDQRAADLAKIDGEIARLGRHIAEKEAALEADVQKHLSEMSHTLQQRLEDQIGTLRRRIAKLHEERFQVELGDLAEPKAKPAAAATPAKQHREWDNLEPVMQPQYPAIGRTAENHETFSEAFERTHAFYIHRKNMGLKRAGCNPDDRVHLDLVAMVTAQGEANFHWLTHRCAAIEARLAEIESRPSMAYRGVWDRGMEYHRGDVCTHQGSSWHCELDAATGLQPGEGLGWKLMAKRGRDGKDARP